ncbi:DUF302 domain-containing protein [Saccharopolyspora sp. K220]|uniref:DUF302 domain-containing protein n=1 Tax=Saccharopolyspora soli TaxID=2926618 RepID=UPI001F591578|nr:DUF302 domain-containing protein [Saccharopolyspora soli]MCI2417454.1 DUF302 domain-containing protein [Saccharopolyspora soli]
MSGTENVHEVRRLAVPLPLPYAEAVAKFEEIVPVVDAPRFMELSSWAEVEALAEKEAPLGFMRYWTADISELMVGGTALWECSEYLMGNHVIAERMYRYDPSVMLHAPLRVVIRADDSGTAVFVIDQPSTLFDSYERREIAEVGRELDAKVAAVLRALGAEPPAVLVHDE